MANDSLIFLPCSLHTKIDLMTEQIRCILKRRSKPTTVRDVLRLSHPEVRGRSSGCDGLGRILASIGTPNSRAACLRQRRVGGAKRHHVRRSNRFA